MKLKDLQPNDRNPRYITEPSFDALIDSLLGFPEMLNVRGIVFTKTKTGKKGVIFGANQRFRALLAICEMSAEARAERIRRIVSFSESINKLSVPAHQRIEYLIDFWTPIAISREVPAKWANDVTGWTPEQIEEFTIRDNVPSGAWDMDLLANEWAAEGLGEWGLDLPEFGKDLSAITDEFPDATGSNKINEIKCPKCGFQFVK